jgi:hypothetical protein
LLLSIKLIALKFSRKIDIDFQKREEFRKKALKDA